MKKNKLTTLEDLKITSFITSTEHIRGGAVNAASIITRGTSSSRPSDTGAPCATGNQFELEH